MSLDAIEEIYVGSFGYMRACATIQLSFVHRLAKDLEAIEIENERHLAQAEWNRKRWKRRAPNVFNWAKMRI